MEVILAKKTHIKLVLFCYTCSSIIRLYNLTCVEQNLAISFAFHQFQLANTPRVHHKIGYKTTSQRARRQYNFKSNLKIKCSSQYALASLKPRASLNVFSFKCFPLNFNFAFLCCPPCIKTPYHMENFVSYKKSKSTCTQMCIDVQQVDFIAYFL